MKRADLQAMAQRERGPAAGIPLPAAVLRQHPLPLLRRHGRAAGPGGGRSRAQAGRRGGRRRHRLHGTVQPRPDGHGADAGPGRRLLRERHAGERPPDRRRARGRRPAGRRQDHAQRPALLHQADARSCSPTAASIDPERLEDYVARGGYAALAHALREMTPGRGVRRDQQERPARPRRRRLSHRPQVGPGAQGPRRQEIRHRQRRRGRPRRLHGPHADGVGPAPRAGRHGHRRLRRRRGAGLPLRARRVSRWRPSGWRRPSARPSGAACWAAACWRAASASASTSASAPAPSSAARRPR